MCVLVLGWHWSAAYPLVFAGNRDEFHRRPTEPMDWWTDPPILAGRDREAGGTWLGLSPEGRFAVVTNFREPDPRPSGARSRGELVLAALDARRELDAIRDGIGTTAHYYGGFNLLVGEPLGAGAEDGPRLLYLSNRGGGHDEPRFVARELGPGLYGLSNHLLETPWPKVRRLKGGIETLGAEKLHDTGALFDILCDSRPAPDRELPDTGVGERTERLLSPPFIRSPDYGTRSSTVVLASADGTFEVEERRFDPDGAESGRSREVFRIRE